VRAVRKATGRGGGGCSRCTSEGGRRRGKNGAQRCRAAPFLNSAVGSRGRGGGWGVCGMSRYVEGENGGGGWS
jgi:hypothetical protein